MDKTVEDIENGMRDLFPKKELAYMDYLDNTGDTSGVRERLWDEFETYRKQWNALVIERKELINIGRLR